MSRKAKMQDFDHDGDLTDLIVGYVDDLAASELAADTPAVLASLRALLDDGAAVFARERAAAEDGGHGGISRYQESTFALDQWDALACGHFPDLSKILRSIGSTGQEVWTARMALVDGWLARL